LREAIIVRNPCITVHGEVRSDSSDAAASLSLCRFISCTAVLPRNPPIIASFIGLDFTQKQDLNVGARGSVRESAVGVVWRWGGCAQTGA
uniref:Recep_L_domain domain-containing protein n=1 Tax=Toxocara canis TaxID=6265 RepID=A0A183VGM6_TOXCA